MSATRRALLGAALATPAAAQPAFAPQQDDATAPGRRRTVLVRWGDRVTSDAPAWAPGRPDADAAAAQFGWDARVAALLPAPPGADGVPRATLAVAHPTVEAPMAFPDGADRPAVAAATGGASLLNLARGGGGWQVIEGGFQNRRLGASTLCRLTGPAAPSPAVQGLVGVTGGTATPWGTLLLTEDATAWLPRLAALDARFADGAGFGWVVELDPADPGALPAKRTALGRMAHGDAAATRAADGRAAVFLCDRRPGGALYRFVAEAASLDAGTLSVARIEGDRVRWTALPAGAARDPAAAGGGTPVGAAALAWAPGRPLLLLGTARGALGVAFERDPAAETARLVTVWAGAPVGGVAAGPDGRTWIATAPEPRVGDQAATLFMTGADGRGARAVYAAPRAAALGGAALLPDGAAVVGVRHPGAEPGARFARPATRWPDFAPGVPPRSAVVAVA